MTNTIIATAKALTFGTELEYTNISRERAARAIHTVVGGTVAIFGIIPNNLDLYLQCSFVLYYLEIS